jgi:hypothetical protein
MKIGENYRIGEDHFGAPNSARDTIEAQAARSKAFLRWIGEPGTT